MRLAEAVRFETDGTYPTEATLNVITRWPAPEFLDLMEFIRPYWSEYPGYGSFRERHGVYRLATGGWSGNEDIIRALEQNTMFQMLSWQMSRRGGLHIFHVRDCPA